MFFILAKVQNSHLENSDVQHIENSTSIILNNDNPSTRKYRIDSNNNYLDCIDENLVKTSNFVKKNDDKYIETSNLTPPKSPNSKSKANSAKSPLTSVKQKINRFVPNMFQIFTQNNTPPSTNFTHNYASNINTPMSISSASSSPSPLSVSSSSSASSSVSNPKNIKHLTSVSKIFNNNNVKSNLAESFDDTPGVYSNRLKSQYKISTPTSTISYNYKTDETSNFSSKSLFLNTEPTSNKISTSRAKSINRQMSAGTPIRASPKQQRKLSCNSDRSNDYDVSHSDSQDNTELYFNDKAMSKKEPGSGCEFLTHKLNSHKQLQIELQTNNSISKSTINSEESSLSLDNSKTPVNFKHVVNQAKLSNGKQIDLRSLNQPLKAEFYDCLPSKSDDDQENSPDQNETPKPPVRTKIQTKRINLNDTTRSPLYNIVDIDLGNELSSSQNFPSDTKSNQLPNKLVEIRLNKTSKSGANFESFSDNFGLRNYRNGVLLDINSNSQKEFDLKDSQQDQSRTPQSYYVS